MEKVVLLIVIFFVLFFILLARLFLEIVTIIGPSMEPTLYDRDRILIVKHWPLRWLRFNEVVVINISKISTISSSLPFNQYVKRVTGLPQTAVKIHLSDLHELVQTSLREKCNHEGYLIWEIPPRHFFVRGDAKLSNDSLIWGALPSSALVGVMVTKLPKQATHISSDNKKQIFPS